MRILLFITGHRQLEEYSLFQRLLSTLSIQSQCDIFIYCNHPGIHPDIVKYYQQFPQRNKQLFLTTQNAGYLRGGVEAVGQGFAMGLFEGYDYVIHLHPDVFMTDDAYLIEQLLKYLNDDTVFLITKSFAEDTRFFSFDFFVFKPKWLSTNFFKEGMYKFQGAPEHFLHDQLVKHGIKYAFLKRFNNDTWCPRRIDDHLKLYHEHDLEKVRQLARERGV